MPRSTLFAYMIFIKNNEINESYKLCQVRGKHTVGGIVFYKHLFLVMMKGFHPQCRLYFPFGPLRSASVNWIIALFVS